MKKTDRNAKRDVLINDFVYNILNTITNFMDKRFIDPLIGFLFPAFGDTLMSVLVIPYLYVSIFKVRSVALTLAIIFNTLTDMLLGVIPYGIGDVMDVFHRSYAKNMRLIDGFVDGDENIIKSVKRKALIFALLIVVMCIILFFIFKFAISLITEGVNLLMTLF